MGSAAKRVVPDLIKLKGSTNWPRAIEALATMREEAAAAVPSLLQSLDSPHEDIRTRAANALLVIGAELSGDVRQQIENVFVAGLIGPNSTTKWIAPRTISHLKISADPQLVRGLVRLVKTHDETFYPVQARVDALWLLGTMKAQLREFTQAVLMALNDPAADVRYKAAETLALVDPESQEVWTALFKLVRNDTEYRSIRKQAALSLGRLAKQHDEVHRELLTLSEHEDTKLRELAAYALEAPKKSDEEP